MNIRDKTAWFAHAARCLAPGHLGGLPAGPALPMLLDDGYTRVINFASALGDGSLQIWRGACTKNAG